MQSANKPGILNSKKLSSVATKKCVIVVSYEKNFIGRGVVFFCKHSMSSAAKEGAECYM